MGWSEKKNVLYYVCKDKACVETSILSSYKNKKRK